MTASPAAAYHEPKSDPAADYVAGALAGSANIVTGFPFDTVKVRLQADASPYKGPWHCFTTIVRHEGLRRVYRGLSSPLIGGALETGANYLVFKGSMELLEGSPLAVPVSAAAAGLTLSFIVSPAELIKCRMQLGAMDTTHTYTGPMDCVRQLVRSEGYAGLMRGLQATVCREVPGNIVYFGTYLAMRECLPGKIPGADQPRSLAEHAANAASAIACGAAAGMSMWAAILPIDVAKTRIQTAWPGSAHDVGVLTQLRLLHREGGLRSLYAGLMPTMIRAAPANAAQWLTWELCMQQWHKWKS